MSDQADTESALRHQVAAVSLLLNAENILGYSGHVSVRLPGRDEFLIQPVDQSRAQLRPEHLLICGMDGKSRERSNRARPPSEVFIHTEIFRARSDVNAIAHAEAQGNAWSGGIFNGNAWSGNGWSGNSWTGNSWSGNSWSGNSWSGNSWSGNSWSGSGWASGNACVLPDRTVTPGA